jgi:hypothetical protein
MPTPVDQQEIYVTIWAKAVDTQMHFNEKSVQSRQLGLAFITAALGLAIVLLGHGDEFSISVALWNGFDIQATVLVILGSAFALWGVRILDLNVYHRMLRGAVSFGEDFEQQYMKQIFDLEKGMTQAISHFSRHADAAVTTGPNTKFIYGGISRKNAEDKIRKFYNYCTFALIGMAVGVFLITGHFGHPTHLSSAAPISSIEQPANGKTK